MQDLFSKYSLQFQISSKKRQNASFSVLVFRMLSTVPNNFKKASI